LNSETRKTEVTNNSPGNAFVQISAFQHTLTSAFVTPNAVGDRAHLTIILSSVFPTRFIMVIIIQCRWSASACSPFIVILPLLPRVKVQISLHPGLLFYLVSLELILLPYKIAHLSSRLYLPGVLGATALTAAESHCYPTPPHLSPCDHTPTFLSVHFFLKFVRPHHMACHFRVNCFPLGNCLYIFSSHVCAFPYPLPLRFAFRSIFLAFPWGSAVRITAHGGGKVPGPPPPCHPPRGSFLCYGLALRPLSVSILSVVVPSCRPAIMDPISYSLRIGSLGAVPCPTYVHNPCVFSFPLTTL